MCPSERVLEALKLLAQPRTIGPLCSTRTTASPRSQSTSQCRSRRDGWQHARAAPLSSPSRAHHEAAAHTAQIERGLGIAPHFPRLTVQAVAVSQSLSERSRRTHSKSDTSTLARDMDSCRTWPWRCRTACNARTSVLLLVTAVAAGSGKNNDIVLQDLVEGHHHHTRYIKTRADNTLAREGRSQRNGDTATPVSPTQNANWSSEVRERKSYLQWPTRG